MTHPITDKEILILEKLSLTPNDFVGSTDIGRMIGFDYGGQPAATIHYNLQKLCRLGLVIRGNRRYMITDDGINLLIPQAY